MKKRISSVLFVLWLFAVHLGSASAGALPAGDALGVVNPPRILLLFDPSPTKDTPGELEALFTSNLLGHFGAIRTVQPIGFYKSGDWRKYDAIFCNVYQTTFTVSTALIEDLPEITKPFCWVGDHSDQLDRLGELRNRGIHFERRWANSPYSAVTYHGRIVNKSDPAINVFSIRDRTKASVIATAIDGRGGGAPYIIRSGNLWIVADSPYAYTGENDSESDRYLVFADVLHDILGIPHQEDHRALARIEDISASSVPDDLKATLDVLRSFKIPFSFGYTPMFVDPNERLILQLSERPEVVNAMKQFVAIGGTPVLHGYTHQYRGVTPDDYEFWDDLADRPVRGDSTSFVSRRLEEAIRDSMEMGLYPLTWETPHYAASPLDYQVFKQFFKTVYERRLTKATLASDQFFPYPVIDNYGQLVIPEDTAYIPIENQDIRPLVKNADAALVVRDGYASFFYHPFLRPELLKNLISQIQGLGYHFVSIKSFPNRVVADGRVITTENGPVKIKGKGHFFNTQILGDRGQIISEKATEVPFEEPLTIDVNLKPGQVFVGTREDMRAPTRVERLVRLAKGDLSFAYRRVGNWISARAIGEPTSVVVLWNSKASMEEDKDQEGFLSAVSIAGFDTRRIEISDFAAQELDPFSLLIVPHSVAATMTQEQMERVIQSVKGGITVVTDGESDLGAALGIKLGNPSVVRALASSLDASQEIRWADGPQVPWIAEPSGFDVEPLFNDRETGHTLAMAGRLGAGHYVYFSSLFSSLTGSGFDRFPDFPNILMSTLNLSPLVKRSGVDAYFDPGYRQSISIEKLARSWHRSGIRAVHVGAWHFYEKYTYDYARLIKVAHQNGILVYAWFEWPQVSQRFWNQHPNWREKNALLQDAHVDWRSLMNFQDPACFKAVVSEMESFMTSADWDGIDVGELTFESLEGPERPEVFTPMNSVARSEFQKIGGFDPLEFFNRASPHYWESDPSGLAAFYRYRRTAINRLADALLSEIRKMEKKHGKQWELIFTQIDALRHPELRDFISIDTDATVALVNKYNAVLQVEDPSSDWSDGPERYKNLGERYKKFPLKRPFMIDINVLPVHTMSQPEFPTATPTGPELFKLWAVAASQASRVSLYSESSVYDQDWKVLPFAMAAAAKVTREGDEWIVQSPYTVALDVGRSARRVVLDGEAIVLQTHDDVIVPPGIHRLRVYRGQYSLLNADELKSRLVFISGELLGYENRPRGIELEYRSDTRCALMFNKEPQKIYLDGETSGLPVVKGDDGYVMIAPGGQHRIRVVTQTIFTYILDFTSWISASLAVLFGMLSSGMLAVLFLFIFIRRRLRLLHRRFRAFRSV